MVKKEDLIYLKHVRDSVLAIEEYISRGGKELYDKDRAIQMAVIKELEIVGEACRHVSPEFRQRYPQIPWSAIVGTRDKLVHDYMGVDLERVWLMAAIKVPELKGQILEILEREE
jgi:uncharacterized protein with HEPN domain